MNRKIILALFVIFVIMASAAAVSAVAHEENFGKFTLSIDGQRTGNLSLHTDGEVMDMYEYDTPNGNVSVLYMSGKMDPDEVINDFIEEDGYKKIGPVGEFTLLETEDGKYEGVYFSDDYWVAVIFEDLNSGKAILESFKLT